MLTQERLKELLDYDPVVGIFIWKIARCNIRAGSIAGWNSKGYTTIQVERKNYFAHRLAWLYVYGVWPTNDIDHRDHNKGNNKISNLRDVTATINGQNQITANIGNLSGFLGVTYDKQHCKYRAQIKVGGKQKYLGLFLTAENAHSAYLSAKRAFHLGCTI